MEPQEDPQGKIPYPSIILKNKIWAGSQQPVEQHTHVLSWLLWYGSYPWFSAWERHTVVVGSIEKEKGYYQKRMTEQHQNLADKTTAVFQQGKTPPGPVSIPPPAGAMMLFYPPQVFQVLLTLARCLHPIWEVPSMMSRMDPSLSRLLPVDLLSEGGHLWEAACPWCLALQWWCPMILTLWWCPLGLAWLGWTEKSRRALHQYFYYSFYFNRRSQC